MPKSTGIVRQLDELGRYVLPIELRRMLDIDIGDSMEFYVDDDRLMMKKYVGSSACFFCRNLDDLVYFKGKLICRTCIDEATSSMPQSPPRKTKTKTRAGTETMLQRLKEEMEKRPDRSQKELGEVMGISQGRVSQLKKLLG